MDHLLALKDVAVAFGGLKALSGVSLGVATGEVVAVIGPNGAGKTTLFNAITGLVPLRAGRIELSGERIDTLLPHDIAGRGVRRTFQNGGLCGHLTVLENVLAGASFGDGGQLRFVVVGLPPAPPARRAPRGRGARGSIGGASCATSGDSAALPAISHQISGAASSAWWRSCERSRRARQCSCSTSPPSASRRPCGRSSADSFGVSLMRKV